MNAKNKLFVLTAAMTALLLVSCASSGKIEKNTVSLDISSMTLEEKIAQMFVIQPESTDANYFFGDKANPKGATKITSSMKSFYKSHPAGGFILFKENIKNPRQLKKLTKTMHALSPQYPLIYIDEEGGRVARIGNKDYFNEKKFPPMGELTKSRGIDGVREAGETIGAYLKKYGIDVDFAPVADVDSNPNNPVIGTRAFSSDPNEVARANEVFLDALRSHGIEGCLKHFPGHGDTATDSHSGYAMSAKTWKELTQMEMIPFSEGIKNGAKLIMTAHVSLPNVDPNGVPSTVSKTILTDKLRGELGFKGLIVTDAMGMGAITKQFPNDSAIVLSILAGVDIILMPQDYEKSLALVLEAVKDGTLTEERINESVRRIFDLKKEIIGR